MSFKKVLSAAVALFVIAAMAGCSSASSPSSDSSAPADTSSGTSAAAPTGDPIIIGYVSALSGDTALWGQAGLNGMMMAQDDINAAGGLLGRPVKVIGYDGMGQAADSVNALNKLIDQEHIVVSVGTNFSSCNIPMASIADAKQIPIIATAASSPLVTVDENGNLHPYSFRIGFIDPFQGKVMADYAYNKLNARKAAVITDVGDSYSTGITDNLVQAFTDLGGQVVAKEQGHSGDNDFRAQLSKIQASNPDILFIPWIYKDVALIVKQARDLGITCQFMGGDGWDSQDLPGLAGDAINGGLYVSRPTFNNPDAVAFRDRYEQRFNITAESECLFGYDAMMWIKQVIEEKNSATPQDIRDGLENTTSFDGLLGHMSIDPATHNPTRDAAIYQIKDGQINYIETYSVSQ